MATVSKQFHFQNNTEGWTATAANANVIMGWKQPRRNGRDGNRANGIGITNGGCLRQSYQGNAAGSNKWELTTTWASLGVPTGQTVTSVTADYQFRWEFGPNFVGPILTNANQSGPFELHDSTGSLIGTFSSANSLPTSGSGGHGYDERHYPTGGGMTGAVTDTNHNWLTATGSSVTVPSGSNASGNTVTFRLNSSGQANAHTGWSYVRLKHDRIHMNITYSSAVTTRRRIFIF